jgi:hypothetical protein
MELKKTAGVSFKIALRAATLGGLFSDCHATAYRLLQFTNPRQRLPLPPTKVPRAGSLPDDQPCGHAACGGGVVSVDGRLTITLSKLGRFLTGSILIQYH